MSDGNAPAEDRAMRVTYLYDRPGWALHNLGLMLHARMAPLGVQIDCIRSDEWHDAPAATDCLYLAYTGLWRDKFRYEQWAGTLVTTVHDPCEISHFENRSDWRRFPLLDVPFEQFDRVSVISGELEGLVRQTYGVTVFRTPTWPTTEIAPTIAASRTHAAARCVAIASTILPERFSLRDVLRRARHLRPYLTGPHGVRSWRQLRGLLVLRRRKNIGWLRAIRRHFAGQPDIECGFRYGNSGPLPAADWVALLARADVYVCTSTMEGGPLPVMEAVQAGLAVVSTPVGQVEEWVHDGVNGRICRSLHECIRALDDYRRDPALLAAHQAASLAIARERVFPTAAWIRLFRGI